MRTALKLLVLTLGIVSACLIILSYGTTLTPFFASQAPQVVTPELTAETPPGAPLRISSFRYDLTDPEAPQIVADVVNATDKPIRAYTIREELRAGDKVVGGSTMTSDGFGTDAIIQPRHFATVSLSHVSSRSTETVKAVLLVDFVEFTDGMTWGADTDKFSEWLKGRRFGIREASKHLLKKLETEGAQAVVKALEDDTNKFTPPAGHSPRWTEGFSDGVGFVSGRLKRGLMKGGVAQVASELRRISNISQGAK